MNSSNRAAKSTLAAAGRLLSRIKAILLADVLYNSECSGVLQGLGLQL